MINNSTISLAGGAVTGKVDIGGVLVYLDAEENSPKVVDNPTYIYHAFGDFYMEG